MGNLILILLTFMIAAFFFIGNFMILGSVFGGSTLDWGYWFILLVAIVIDLILLYLTIKKYKTPVVSFFRMIRSGFRRRRREKGAAARQKELLGRERPDENRLKELRDKRISERATRQTYRFCKLMEKLAGGEQLQGCFSMISERQAVLDELKDLENSVFKIAESCKDAGDIETCRYYLNLLKAEKVTPKIKALEKECEEQLSLREKERKAMRLWTKLLLGTFAAAAAILTLVLVEAAPYRRLRTMIKDQSLTAEMCSWKNRDSEESYYYYFRSKKGYKLLASELVRLYREDDVDSAMWLLCIQPDCINGYDMQVSPSFVSWIVGYVKDYGIRSTDQEDSGSDFYNVIYTVDGYQVIINSYDDQKPDMGGISDFIIGDGENTNTIYAR